MNWRMYVRAKKKYHVQHILLSLGTVSKEQWRQE